MCDRIHTTHSHLDKTHKRNQIAVLPYLYKVEVKLLYSTDRIHTLLYLSHVRLCVGKLKVLCAVSVQRKVYLLLSSCTVL